MYIFCYLVVHGDARNMKTLFENESFDCVIDKGLLDSILVRHL